MENAERALQHIPVLDRHGKPTGEYRYDGSVANRALELLGKQQGMFIDRHEVGRACSG
jgi:phage terminase small subunit